MHVGHPYLPLESFVRNGTHRRHVCRHCWARKQRERLRDPSLRKPDKDEEEAKQTLLARMLNKLWRPTAVS